MLSKVSCQKDYRRAQRRVARDFSVYDWDRLNKDPQLSSARDKFAFLRVDRAEEALLPPCSPDRGRPAWDPAVLIRSFLLMLHLGHTSVQRWHDALAADALLRWLVGSEGVPSVGAHYDFINRVTGDDPHRDVYYPKGLFTEELKEMRKKYQLKRGEKLVNFDDGDTAELTRKYWDDASADCGRWSLPLELLFFHVAVSVSMETYPIAGGTASGDGTCLHIHASKSGHRVKDDAEAEKDADGRPLTHRYSAPDANVGWDSDVGDYFYGFAMYNVSWHSREHGIDLPLFVALRSASQHDSLTCVSAVAHMLDVAPGLRPAFFCHDSAADAARIFEWLRHRGVVPIIDWNPRQSSKDPDERRPVERGIKGEDGRPLEYINDRGVPVCACGHEMARDGYDRSKQATKYRCPFAVGRIKECEWWGKCTKSEYGRVKKVYDKTNYKLFGPVVYRSDQWKDVYKDRTCTERVNNRILNDYGLHALTCRNGYKHFFFAIMAAINIHMDAWVKTSA